VIRTITAALVLTAVTLAGALTAGSQPQTAGKDTASVVPTESHVTATGGRFNLEID